MSELDPRIATLFVRQEEVAASEAFTAAVLERVRMARVVAGMLGAAGVLAVAAVIGVALVLAPSTPLETIRRAGELLISPEGTVASLVPAVALVGWLRFAEV